MVIQADNYDTSLLFMHSDSSMNLFEPFGFGLFGVFLFYNVNYLFVCEPCTRLAVLLLHVRCLFAYWVFELS